MTRFTIKIQDGGIKLVDNELSLSVARFETREELMGWLQDERRSVIHRHEQLMDEASVLQNEIEGLEEVIQKVREEL